MDPTKEPPFIVPVFLPQAGCPHQCVFCNQFAITQAPAQFPTPEQIRQIIRRFLSYPARARKISQIAFYGGNFLGLSPDQLHASLSAASRFVAQREAGSIRFSTRPDTIKEDRLDLLRGYPVQTIELGVQSMDDRVLEKSRRGHTAADTITAVRRLKARGYEIGLQMMVGLPGDSPAGALASAAEIAALKPDFVRIYPTLVLKKSPLAVLMQRGGYTPLSLASCVELVKKIYLLFEAQKIPVIRIGLQVSETGNGETEILGGPYHPAFGDLVHSALFMDRLSAALKPQKRPLKNLAIRVHPRSVSRLRGHKNCNIKWMQEQFGIRAPRIVIDSTLAMDRVALQAGPDLKL